MYQSSHLDNKKVSTHLLGQHQDRAEEVNPLNQEVNFWQVEATLKLDNVTIFKISKQNKMEKLTKQKFVKQAISFKV